MNRKNRTGFTLIETLLTITIFALVMGAISSFILYTYRTHAYIFQQSVAINQARKGIATMIREIREARDGDDGSYTIEKADEFEFIFFSDINKDDDTERVRYFVDGTNFKKGIIQPEGWPISYPQDKEVVSILSAYVRNAPPIFRYFDGDNQELIGVSARLQDVKIMSVHLIVNVNSERSPEEFVLESNVHLRNLKINL